MSDPGPPPNIESPWLRAGSIATGLCLLAGAAVSAFLLVLHWRPAALYVWSNRARCVWAAPGGREFLAVTPSEGSKLARNSFDRPTTAVPFAEAVSSQSAATAVSADGALAVTCGSGRRLVGLDGLTGRALWDVNVEYLAGVGLAALSGDARKALLACDDGLAVCDVEARRIVRYARCGLQVRSLDVAGDFSLAALGGEGVIQIWDLSTHQPLRLLEGHYGTVLAVRFSRDGRRLLAADDHGTVRLWETATGRCLRCWDFSGPANRSFALSPDGRRFLEGAGRSLRVWDVSGDGPVASLVAGLRWQPDAAGAAFSIDGKSVLIPCGDGKVRLWNVGD